jgi:DNA-directed RNA polymerase-3 subunit RPC5
MPSTNLPGGARADDDDPIVARYSVFLKPPLPEHRKLVVFQFVTKTAQDPTQLRVPRITELRVKPDSGMYEVDVPIDTSEAYDRAKGMAWGAALQKSMEAKGKDGSLGLAGGFNIVATPGTGAAGGGRRRAAAAAAEDEDGAPLTWAEATRQGKVLRTQTFGGVRSAQEKHTRHMIGVFQGSTSYLHLFPFPKLPTN